MARQLHASITDVPHFVVPKFQPAPPGKTFPGGFAQISNRVIDLYWTQMSDIAKNVYVVLCRLANHKDNYCVSIGQTLLMEKTGLGEKSVRRALHELIYSVGCVGLVREGGTDERGNRCTAIYQLLCPVELPDTGVQPDRGPVSPSSQTGVQPDPSTGVQPVPDRGLARPPNKTVDKHSTNSGGGGRIFLQEEVGPELAQVVAVLEAEDFEHDEAVSLAKVPAPKHTPDKLTHVQNMIANAQYLEGRGEIKSSRLNYLRRAINGGWETHAGVVKAQKRKEQAAAPAAPVDPDLQRTRRLFARYNSLTPDQIRGYKERLKAGQSDPEMLRRIERMGKDSQWLRAMIVPLMEEE